MKGENGVAVTPVIYLNIFKRANPKLSCNFTLAHIILGII